MSPKGRDARVPGELVVRVHIAPKRRDGCDHPGRRNKETKEQQTITESCPNRSASFPLPRHGASIVSLLAVGRPDFSVAFSTTPFYMRGAMAADDQKIPDDLTPIVAAPTDIAPLGHGQPKPPHERTADEEPDVIDWERLAASERFRSLLKAKRRFIVPATIFFIAYYFALPVLIGYARPFMEKRVWGPVNLAYLFALSQFFMAWIIAALYVRAAARFDRMAADVVSQSDDGPVS
jgi:uncharacterized membrane protein (DUF485 family)